MSYMYTDTSNSGFGNENNPFVSGPLGTGFLARYIAFGDTATALREATRRSKETGIYPVAFVSEGGLGVTPSLVCTGDTPYTRYLDSLGWHEAHGQIPPGTTSSALDAILLGHLVIEQQGPDTIL